MKETLTTWTKEELKIYILCLCANADLDETKEELDIIKSKTDKATFEKIHAEFMADNEDTCFEKIDNTVERLFFSNMELSALKKDIFEVFYSNDHFTMKERNLDLILNNMLY